MTLAYTLLVIATAWLIYVYVGYPLCLWILARFRSVQHAADDSYLPFVSVLIAARNEEKDIGWKVRQTLGWDYPKERLEVLVASDASDDRTDEILRQISDPRLRFVRIENRGGKVRALNRLARIATGELLFFTDANSDIAPGALRFIVRHFADPRVGCVTGCDRTASESLEGVIGAGEKTYWDYEAMVNELESRNGTVLVCFGAIHCVRRSLYVDCDPDLANDLEVPMRIGTRGYSVLWEPRSVCVEKATESASEEFKRRRRICGQGALAYARLMRTVRGLRAWQFFSRKLLRWLAVCPATVAFAGSAILSRHSELGRNLLAAQLAFYLAAAIGWMCAERGWRGTYIFALPFYFVLVHLAAFLGVIDAVVGRRYATWNAASLTRGKPALIAQPHVLEDLLAQPRSVVSVTKTGD